MTDLISSLNNAGGIGASLPLMQRQPAVYAPPDEFYNLLSPLPLPRVHRIFVDSADIHSSYGGQANVCYETAMIETGHSRTPIEGTVIDRFTWQVHLPTPIKKGKLFLSNMQVFTGIGGFTTVLRISIENFPYRSSYSSSTGTAIQLTTNGPGTLTNGTIQSFALNSVDGKDDGIPVENVPASFPLTIRVDHQNGSSAGGFIVTTGSGTLDLRRVIAMFAIVELPSM